MNVSNSDSDFDSPINRFANSDANNVRISNPKIPRNLPSNKGNNTEVLEIETL